MAYQNVGPSWRTAHDSGEQRLGSSSSNDWGSLMRKGEQVGFFVFKRLGSSTCVKGYKMKNEIGHGRKKK
ncbi:hypothetical protein SESBI_31002 [Sesbania bispinosa]|nr:hypothetical protein SESBI_31002 [Sesbania bispinosa]